MAQRVKNLPAMQETWVRSLGHENPLEKEVATHSNIFAWRIPWTEATVHGVPELDNSEQLTLLLTSCFPSQNASSMQTEVMPMLLAAIFSISKMIVHI